MRRVLVTIAVLSLSAVISSGLRAAPLRIGFAEADITPPEGYPMAGYYHERLSTGIRDPLKAKAVVVLGEQEQAAIVVCDLIGISYDLTSIVRKRVADKLNIPEQHIVVAGTHSHTAPDYTRELFDYVVTEKPRSDGKPSYSEKLISGICNALLHAHAAAQPVTVRSGSARQTVPVSFNRRFVMRDGSVRTWMNYRTAGVVRAAGPIDDEVGLVEVRDSVQQKPLGLISNFALHLDTVGGTQWSADYPFYVQQATRTALGEGVVSLFATGTCGDINHADPSKSERNTTDFIGQSLGQTVVRGLAELQTAESSSLRVRSAVVRLPLQVVSEGDVRKSEQILSVLKNGGKVEFLDQVLAYKTIMLDHLQHSPSLSQTTDYISWGLSRKWAGIGSELPVEVQVIALGDDVAIVCLPGEVFVDLGLAIKRASPFRTTIIVELANCVESIYIPTRVAYANGSYEVTNAALQPGSGEILVATAVGLLREVAAP